MAEGTLVTRVLGGFLAAVAPLKDALASPQAFAAFLGGFGWTLTDADVAKVTGSLGDVSSAASDPSSLSEDELASEVGSIATAIRGIAGSGAPAAFVSTFPGELLDWVVYGAVAGASPGLFAVLHLVGVVEESRVAADPTIDRAEHVDHLLHWDRLGGLADDPAATVASAYGWGGALEGDAFLRSVGMFAQVVGADVSMPVAARELLDQYYAPGSPDVAGTRNLLLSAPFLHASEMDAGVSESVSLTFLALPIPPSPSAVAPVDGLAVMPVITGTASDTIPLSDDVSLTLAGDFLSRPVRAELHPGSSVVRGSPGDTHVDASARVDAKAPATTPWLAFGDAGTSRLEVSAAHALLGLSGQLDGDLELKVEVGLDSGALVIDLSDGDGFVQDATSGQTVRSSVSLVPAWSSKSGFTLGGQPRLAVTIPVSASLLDVLQVQAIGLALSAASGGVAFDATVTFTVTLGPFGATIKDAGVRTLISGTPDGSPPGNLGSVDLGFGFKPPSGVGLSVNAGPIGGGGFIDRDPATGRYAGVLDLRAGQIDIGAVGLIETLPGQSGYALLMALHATFPEIELGFGFALISVGGLLALNRRIDVDALRSRLQTGTAGRILAPQDPIHNAPAIVADLEAVFPVAPGVTVVGPTVQLTWAELVHLDIGVFIELPGPSRVVLLGSAHAEIARDGQTYLSIRIDIVGVIDLRAETAAFDAALIDSHLMGMLDLTGGAAFRLSFGSQPYAVLSLGGFHPSYDPAPLTFPASLTRIAMVHGKPTDEVYLRFEGYFAVTSNTLQFGAAVEAAINFGGWAIHGSLTFDALIQRVPFHFGVDIRASVAVSYHGHNLASLTLTGSLTGPGPVVLRAKVCIELLFFDVCFSHTFELGSSTPPPEPVAPDLLDVLHAELTDPARLRAAGDPDPFVRLLPVDPALTTPLVVPTGTLVWEQPRAPLDLLLTRVGGTPLPAPAQVHASSPASADVATDWFAPGQFLDLTDDQALTRPGYELLGSGLRLAGGGSKDGPSAQTTLTTRQIRLPAAPEVERPPLPFPTWILTSARAAAVPAIELQVERWVLSTPAGDQVDLTGAQARQLAAAMPGSRAIPETDRIPALSF